MEANFDVSGKEFKIVFSMFGIEKYYYDGRLLLRRWSFKFKDRLRFEVGGCVVEIDVSMTYKSFSTQAFVNNELAVEELFPEFKTRVETSNPKTNNRSLLVNFVLWLVLSIVLLSLFQWFK